MASHAYLFIKGIEGSCKAEGHEKEIEITKLTQNFSFSKENIKTGGMKQNITSLRDPLEFTKYFDKASPKLLEACCIGQVFDECRLMLYRSVYPSASGKVTLSAELLNNFVHIKLYNVYVTYYNISHSGDDLPVETIKMNYDKVEFKFAQGDPKTGKKGQQKIISWDWTTNKAEEKGE